MQVAGDWGKLNTENICYEKEEVVKREATGAHGQTKPHVETGIETWKQTQNYPSRRTSKKLVVNPSSLWQAL